MLIDLNEMPFERIPSLIEYIRKNISNKWLNGDEFDDTHNTIVQIKDAIQYLPSHFRSIGTGRMYPYISYAIDLTETPHIHWTEILKPIDSRMRAIK